MFCRSSIPVGSENVILLYAIAILTASTQFSFSIDVAAFRSFFEPLRCLLLICDSKPEILVTGDTNPRLRFRDTILLQQIENRSLIEDAQPMANQRVEWWGWGGSNSRPTV